MLNSIKIYADKLNGKFNFLGLLRFYWIMMMEIVALYSIFCEKMLSRSMVENSIFLEKTHWNIKVSSTFVFPYKNIGFHYQKKSATNIKSSFDCDIIGLYFFFIENRWEWNHLNLHWKYPNQTLRKMTRHSAEIPQGKHENGKLPSGLSAFEISSNNKRSIGNISSSLFSIEIIDRPRMMSSFIFHHFQDDWSFP